MKNKIVFCTQTNTWSSENSHILVLNDCIVLENDSKTVLKQTNLSEFDLSVWENENWYVTQTVKAINNTLYQVERTWKNRTKVARSASFCTEIQTKFSPKFYLIPCVSYNDEIDNPKNIFFENTFSFSRTGIPSATFCENDSIAVGLFAAIDLDSIISSCKISKQDDIMVQSIFWPEREEPLTYSAKKSFTKGYINEMILQPQGEFKASCFVGIELVQDVRYGWAQIYKTALPLFKKDKEAIISDEEVWQAGIYYAKEYLYNEDEENSFFEMGLSPKDGELKINGKTREIGWCGQNSTFALAFLYHAYKTGDAKYYEVGSRVLDSWQNTAHKETGLFPSSFGEKFGDKSVDTVDACNLGWGAVGFLNAYDLSIKRNAPNESWLKAGIKVCDFITHNFSKEYGFGKHYNIDGTCLETSGTSGAFALLPLLKAYELTKNADYLNFAKKILDFFVQRDLNFVRCVAGALDTDCVDKESCWPLLFAACKLYKITGDENYIRSAEKAGDYIATWMYFYDVPSAETSDFSKYGYSTYGATSVSIHHHHLDPYGALISIFMQDLFEITKNPFYQVCAQAMWSNSLLCISDGKTEVNGFIRPRGSQNEAYFQTGFRFPGASDENCKMNDWLVAWPSAFRLLKIMENNEKKFC